MHRFEELVIGGKRVVLDMFANGITIRHELKGRLSVENGSLGDVEIRGFDSGDYLCFKAEDIENAEFFDDGDGEGIRFSTAGCDIEITSL